MKAEDRAYVDSLIADGKNGRLSDRISALLGVITRQEQEIERLEADDISQRDALGREMELMIACSSQHNLLAIAKDALQDSVENGHNPDGSTTRLIEEIESKLQDRYKSGEDVVAGLRKQISEMEKRARVGEEALSSCAKQTIRNFPPCTIGTMSVADMTSWAYAEAEETIADHELESEKGVTDGQTD